MATWIWPWRRTMPGRVLLTGLMASPRIERLGTMYRKYRTPISGRVRAGSRMRSSMHMRSTKTLRRTAASYSLTNRQGFQISVFSFQFSFMRYYWIQFPFEFLVTLFRDVRQLLLQNFILLLPLPSHCVFN